MSEHQAFLASQAKNYGEIAEWDKKIRAGHGIQSDKAIRERSAGFSLAVRWDPKTLAAFAELSRRITTTIPAFRYQADELHTTVGMSERGAQFAYDPDSETHAKILSVLGIIGEELQAMCAKKACMNNFSRYLISPQNVLGIGEPNEQFVDMIAHAAKISKESGIEFTPAWGAHCTIARFGWTLPVEKLHDFFRLMDTASPPGESRATEVVVWYGRAATPKASKNWPDEKPPVYNVLCKSFPLV